MSQNSLNLKVNFIVCGYFNIFSEKINNYFIYQPVKKKLIKRKEKKVDWIL